MLFRDNIIGWGNKFSGRRAKIFARLFNSSYLINEDGFIAYIERKGFRLSLLSDTKEAYYQAKQNSDLVNLISNDLVEDESRNVTKIINCYKTRFISKYNAERDYEGTLNHPYVLLVDQVYGDLSVKYGMADGNSFKEMLDCAFKDFPNHSILIKIHPDVYNRKKRGYFDIDALKKNSRIQIIAENCHPIRLIRESDAVYTVTSQVGFEALIWGKKVKCFGMPFYAGWGLTEDVLSLTNRKKIVSLEQLVHAALVKYPIYFDPETNKLTTVEKTIEYIGYQRQMRFRFTRKLYAYGFTPWKKSILRSFTQGSELSFIKHLEEAPIDSTVLVWGSLNCEKLHKSVKIVRVEDGFLRSVGLGGDLICPQSWVFDNEGIYYDSSNPSQLENILNYDDFKTEELERADGLIKKLIKNRISKYNLGDHQLEIKNFKKTTILVVGQV